MILFELAIKGRESGSQSLGNELLLLLQLVCSLSFWTSPKMLNSLHWQQDKIVYLVAGAEKKKNNNN
jgi:hypothetical protein